MLALTSLALVLLSAVDPDPTKEEPGEYTLETRDFELPVRVIPERRGEIGSILLFLSEDRGRTWKQVDTAAPDKKGFPFKANRDGSFWFAIQIVDKEGNRDPQDVSRTTNIIKVLIDTRMKHIP